ncbi:MAG: hypothetical protein ACR2FE_00935 [Aeromicrobium sp.]
MKATPRPSAVTMACVFVGLSSFLMLIQLVGALTSWGTIEMQKAVQPALGSLQESGFDVTMGEVLGILRWIGLGTVVLLVAAIVFAVYAVRGDHVSRIGATATAVVLALLIVPFGAIGILQAAFLLLAAGTFWAPDARRWYGTQREQAGLPATAQSDTVPDAWAVPNQSDPITQAQTAAAPAAPMSTTHRPSSVLAAGLVTVIGSAVAGGMAALYLMIYGFARAEIVTGIEEGPFADWYQPGEIDEGLRTVFWASLVILPLAVAGFAAGMSLLARLAVGRVATLALAWITVPVGIVAIPLGLLGTAAAVAVILLLNRDESRAWTADAR